MKAHWGTAQINLTEIVRRTKEQNVAGVAAVRAGTPPAEISGLAPYIRRIQDQHRA